MDFFAVGSRGFRCYPFELHMQGPTRHLTQSGVTPHLRSSICWESKRIWAPTCWQGSEPSHAPQGSVETFTSGPPLGDCKIGHQRIYHIQNSFVDVVGVTKPTPDLCLLGPPWLPTHCVAHWTTCNWWRSARASEMPRMGEPPPLRFAPAGQWSGRRRPGARLGGGATSCAHPRSPCSEGYSTRPTQPCSRASHFAIPEWPLSLACTPATPKCGGTYSPTGAGVAARRRAPERLHRSHRSTRDTPPQRLCRIAVALLSSNGCDIASAHHGLGNQACEACGEDRKWIHAPKNSIDCTPSETSPKTAWARRPPGYPRRNCCRVLSFERFVCLLFCEPFCQSKSPKCRPAPAYQAFPGSRSC